MSRLVIFSESPIDADSVFTGLLKESKINPDRQTFASADDLPELEQILSDEGAEFALLCGEQPLQLVRPDLSTRTVCGRPFYMEDCGMLATVNPSALERNKVWSDSVKMHLTTLVNWAKRPEEFFAVAPKSCAVCADSMVTYLDDSLLPYCDKHK